jgi:high-affinity iron transporter
VGASMLVMIREGFEAALIIAIVLAYLRRIERRDLYPTVWLGVAGAVFLSLVVGVVIHETVGRLEGPARLRAFAGISIVAVAVLTWMIFWMKRQARAIRGELEHKVDRALASSSVGRGLALVAFLAVLREGIEAALFLVAAATGVDGRAVLVGGVIGLAIASALGVMVYAGGRAVPIKTFFTVTGIVIILFAAGLAAKTVFYLQAAGDISSFDWSFFNLTSIHVLTNSSEVGKFLGALVGWDPRPSIEQVAVWLAYVVPITWLFLRDQEPAAVQQAELEPDPEPTTVS